MKKWYFHMGEIYLEFSVDDNEKIELNIPHFRHVSDMEETKQAVRIHLHTVEKLFAPEGIECHSPQDALAWTNGTKISRLGWDYFRKEPHIRTDYDLLEPKVLNCYIRSEYLPWAITEKYLWAGIALPYILLHHQHLIFHASYINNRGRGIIFVAPSGTGKSTQAALWEKYRGAEIINGDKACVKVSENPTVHGVPFDGTSGICKDVSCKLCGIVLIEQAEDNVVRTLPPAVAIQALFTNVFVDRNVRQEWNMALELIINLVENVRIFHLQCTPDERAVETLEKALNQTTNQRK